MPFEKMKKVNKQAIHKIRNINGVIYERCLTLSAIK